MKNLIKNHKADFMLGVLGIVVCGASLAIDAHGIYKSVKMLKELTKQ